MSEQTKIEWADATWNPWIGCTKISPGCANCYAEVSTFTRAKRAHGVELWGRGAKRQRTSEGYWKKPHVWNRAPRLAPGTPRPRIFPSLCDWLDEEVPIEWLADFLKLIHGTPHLDWLLLTKRPENWANRVSKAMLHIDRHWMNGDCARSELGDWVGAWLEGMAPGRGMASIPNNVWIGTSVEDQQRADERIPALLKIPARVRFLSVEPMLGPVRLPFVNWCEACMRTGFAGSTAEPCQECCGSGIASAEDGIHWVIVGGESGPKARPCNVAWVRDIVRQCKAAGAPCFVKQLGSRVIDRNDVGFEGDTPLGWPMDTDTIDDIEPGIYQGKPVRVRLKHSKGGDPSEWPEDLRVREFPRVTP